MKKITVIFTLTIAVLMVCFLTATPVLATMPPQPNYSPGTANLTDNSYAEWDTDLPSNDFFAYGHPGWQDDAQHPATTELFLRYDCTNKVLYALCLPLPGYTMDAVAINDAWIRTPDNNGTFLMKPGGAGNWQWLKDPSQNVIGWEASSAALSIPFNSTICFHSNVNGGATSGSVGKASPLYIICPVQSVPELPTIGLLGLSLAGLAGFIVIKARGRKATAR
jgi:hypothetical protein